MARYVKVLRQQTGKDVWINPDLVSEIEAYEQEPTKTVIRTTASNIIVDMPLHKVIEHLDG